MLYRYIIFLVAVMAPGALSFFHRHPDNGHVLNANIGVVNINENHVHMSNAGGGGGTSEGDADPASTTTKNQLVNYAAKLKGTLKFSGNITLSDGTIIDTTAATLPLALNDPTSNTFQLLTKETLPIVSFHLIISKNYKLIKEFNLDQ